MYIWGSHIFCVLAVYHSLYWAMCESFVYAGELDCIFFSGWWTQKSDDEARSSEANRENNKAAESGNEMKYKNSI